MGQSVLSLIQALQEMLETEIKRKLLIETDKKYLREQYGLGCIIF